MDKKAKGLPECQPPRCELEKDLRKSKLKEIATVCKKTDGFGIIIEVFSEDHGILGDKNDPAYAHVKTAQGEYLGKFAITLQEPGSSDDVLDCDKKQLIPLEYKNSIFKWGKTKNEDKIPGWSGLKFAWGALHPEED
jgi:hypothetical protein